MSSLIGVLQKSGGQVRTVTSQAALIKNSNSGVWEKGSELINKVHLNEVQKKYDEDSQKILFLKSSLHELFKIEPVKTRFVKSFSLKTTRSIWSNMLIIHVPCEYFHHCFDLMVVMVTKIKQRHKQFINVDIRLRMGSVASVVSGITDTLRLKPENHHQDGDVVFRPCSLDQLLDRCGQHLVQAELPPPLPRSWTVSEENPPKTSPT